MRIRRVELNNFRIHDHANVEFQEGINLILGPNGSGKSSVLESIGLALFNTGLRGTQSDAVKAGEKAAKIEVEFEGNDGHIYQVKRKIGNGSGRHELFQNGKLIADKTNDVVEKMKAICGITGRVDEVFENIITAYQNKITEQFLKRPSERRSFFNKIFQTEIYDSISKNYLKDYVDKLTRSTEKLKGKIGELKVDADKLENTEKNIDDLGKKLSSLKNLIGKENSELLDLKKEKEEQESLKQKVNLEKVERLNRINILKKLGKEIQEKLTELGKAEKALKIVTANEVGAKEFERLSEDETVKIKTVESIENKVKQQNQLKEKRIELKNRKTIRETKIENDMENLAKLGEDMAKLMIDIEKANNSHSSLSEKETALSKKLTELEKLVSEIQNAIKEFQNINQSREKILGNLELLQRETVDPDMIQKKITEITRQIVLQQEKMEKYSELKSRKNELDEKLRNIARSSKKLSGGLCPLLDEECLNVKKFGDIKDYFASKTTPLKNELAEIQKQLLNEIEEKEKLEGLKNHKSKNEQILDSSSETQMKINRLMNELEKKENDTEKARLSLIKLIEKTEKLTGLELGENEKLLNTISGFLGTKQSEFKTLKRDLAEKDKELNGLEKETVKLKTSASKIENSVKTNKELNIEAEKQIDLLTEQITIMDKENSVLPQIKAELNDIREKKDKYRGNYDAYQQNRQLANEIESRKSGLILKISETAEYSKESAEQFKRLSKLEDIYIPEKLGKLEKLYIEKSEAYQKLIGEEGRLTGELNSLNNRKKELLEKKKELESTDKKLSRLNQKIILGNKLRNNLKTMGEKVATVFRKNIQQLATENFKKISGRNEEIFWGEDYEVSLIDSKDATNSRTFSNLSGGEQIMVSLCIRAAMSTKMSEAKFVIFDEPTVNLDKERKDLLAQALTPLLGELQQAIIVTHDELFSEMAQQTIRFERD